MINSYISESLKSVGLPTFFSTRGEQKGECLVFNILEIPLAFSDDEEELTDYEVLINLYCTASNYSLYRQRVIDALKLGKFKKKQIPTAMWEEDRQVFNQPFHYKYYK